MHTKIALLAAILAVGCGPAVINSGNDHDGGFADAGMDALLLDGRLGDRVVDVGASGDGPADAGADDDAPVAVLDAAVPEDTIPPQEDAGAPPHCGDGTAEGEARCSIDLAAVVYHDSLDVRDWAVTKTITGIQLSSTDGVRMTLDPYVSVRDGDTWPDFIMWPPDGHLRWTFWLFVRFGGQWHGAAVHEFWYDRVWTGAPLLTGYGDWIYPNPGSPWGEMGDYRPQEGDTVGFMATAGDLRRHKDYLTVYERSTVVTVVLTGDATYTFP